jgi:tetratricopeptide (TPR) repeat protein
MYTRGILMNFNFGLKVAATLLILAIAPFATAQQEETPGSEIERSVPDNPGGIIPQPPDPSTLTPSQDQQFTPDLIIISGRVIKDDGSPPPFGTVIERDCGGVVIKEELVDSNGNFNFVVGDEHRAGNLFPDATENFSTDGAVTGGTSAYSQRSQRRMLKRNYPEDLPVCVVQASYAGYQSTIARLGFGQTSGYIDVGTIVIYPVTREKGTVVSAANLGVPDRARNELEKGLNALEKNDFEKAEKHYRAAIKEYPEYAHAWVELGWLHQKRQNYEAARKAYKEALKLDKFYVNPHIRLAQLSAIEAKWREAEKYSDKALELDPSSFPEAYFFNALAKYNLNQLNSAEDCIRRGIRLDKENKVPKMHLVLANILSKKNDPRGSVNAMRRYLEIKPDASDADQIRSLLKRYEKITENLPAIPPKD